MVIAPPLGLGLDCRRNSGLVLAREKERSMLSSSGRDEAGK